jgi:hypothetical protein
MRARRIDRGAGGAGPEAAKRKLNRETTPEQKGKFFAGLKQIRRSDKDYKPGWASNQYKPEVRCLAERLQAR